MADSQPISHPTPPGGGPPNSGPLGLIAGNGRFPFLLLDAARAHGLTVIVAAIKEETDPEIDARAADDPAIRVHWLLAKLLLSLRTRNTDMLLGAVAKVLSDEGIELISSTHYLEPLLARPGVLTRRAPTEDEQKDIAYGRTVARGLATWDLGQTVV